MFAIVKTGGKQYKVAKDNVVKIEKLDAELGSKIELNEVLMIGDGNKTAVVGAPTVKGASVTAEVVAHNRDPKIIVFKKKRRHNYRRKIGHRQDVTLIKILDVKKA